jgi:phospholipid transport system substrate-binding protein
MASGTMIGMLFRRAPAGKCASLCLALLLTIGLLPVSATAAPAPEAVVQSFYGTLLSTMRQGPVLGQSGRYAQLAPVVDRTFDIPRMTRLALGSAWGTLDPAQQRLITSAFARYIAATYADRFETYSGEQLQVSGERPYGTDLIVETKIVKSNGESTRLDYLLRQDQGSWRISDVYLDGTISQLAVHRAEFNSILRREGVDGLVTALNRKVDLLRSVARSES